MGRRQTTRLAFAFVGALWTLAPAEAAAGNGLDRSAAYIAETFGILVIADHASFETAARDQSLAIRQLCPSPSAVALQSARATFKRLVLTWSRIELFRFGPARSDNLFERIFFWPDRRGRGLRQVQALLAEENPDAIDPERLRRKSVAVQGLPALEFLLFGTGSDALANPEGAYRCGLAAAVAAVIAGHAATLHTAWAGADGHSQLMQRPGADNPLYRNNAEVLQEILRAAAEIVEIVRDVKLGSALGESPDNAKPRRAPFARSDLALDAMAQNLDAVRTLLADEARPPLLPEPHARHTAALRFELDKAREVLDRLAAGPRIWEALAKDPAAREDLAYVLLPLAGAQRLLRETYPAALGLTLGFNSLDGD